MAHGVTMTAELSQAFRGKRQGVEFVLDALAEAFPGEQVKIYGIEGRFLDPAEARERPLEVAAANWAATARFVGRQMADCLLMDIGTTSTDIIPIVAGEPAVLGRTDPERLLSGELIYTGALRTPVEAVARAVPLWGGLCPLAPEGFAVIGDAYLWLGALDARDYSVSPPDGRPATREFAGERIARAVCADAEMLDEEAVGTIARALARGPGLDAYRRAAAGARPAPRARHCGGHGTGRLHRGRGRLPGGARRGAARRPDRRRRANRSGRGRRLAPGRRHRHDVTPLVIKIGGGLLGVPGALDAVCTAVATMGRREAIVVIPGGGPFADAVREVDRAIGLSPDAAHWMAILAMDQYAHLLAGRIAGAVLVEEAGAIAGALATGRVAVLAPSRWLRAADPLPHSWDATSDSVAAFVAGALDARRLVLVKPADVGEAGVDRCFAVVVPAELEVLVLPWNRFAECVTLSPESGPRSTGLRPRRPAGPAATAAWTRSVSPPAAQPDGRPEPDG